MADPFEYVAPARPPRPVRPPSWGQQPYDAGEGTPFGVGVGPGPSQGWNWGGGGGSQGPSFADTKAAFEQTMNDVRGQLSGNVDLGRFGALGGAAMGGVLNPQGFGDEIMRRQMTRLAEREAGMRESQLRTLQNRAAAGGFGRSTSYNDVAANMRGQSAGRLNDAELALMMQDAQLKGQNRDSALRAALGLTSAEQGYRSQFADILANIQRPLPEGGMGGMAGTGGKMPKLDYQGRPTGYYEDGTPLDDAGWQAAWRMREQYARGGV